MKTKIFDFFLLDYVSGILAICSALGMIIGAYLGATILGLIIGFVAGMIAVGITWLFVHNKHYIFKNQDK